MDLLLELKVFHLKVDFVVLLQQLLILNVSFCGIKMN